jgi:putative transposase
LHPTTRLAGRRDRDGVQLIEWAQHRWRAVNSAHLVALVRAGAKFENGVLVERPDESTSGDTHAA